MQRGTASFGARAGVFRRVPAGARCDRRLLNVPIIRIGITEDNTSSEDTLIVRARKVHYEGMHHPIVVCYV